MDINLEFTSQGVSEDRNHSSGTTKSSLLEHINRYIDKINKFMDESIKAGKELASTKEQLSMLLKDMLDTCTVTFTSSCIRSNNSEISSMGIMDLNTKREKEVRSLNINLELTNHKEEENKHVFEEIRSESDQILYSIKKTQRLHYNKVLKNLNKETTAVIVDTKASEDAFSYRDVLLKNINKENLERPKDLIPHRLIVKIRNHDALNDESNGVKELSNINNLCKLSVSKRRSTKIILMGVPENINSDMIIKEIRSDMETDSKELEIIKDFRDKNNMRNIIMVSDLKTGEILINRGKVLLNFVRVRVRKYVDFITCYRCQQPGHYSCECTGNRICANCGDDHDTKECDQPFPKCFRCSDNREHRSDSYHCPMFQELKRKYIAQKRV